MSPIFTRMKFSYYQYENRNFISIDSNLSRIIIPNKNKIDHIHFASAPHLALIGSYYDKSLLDAEYTLPLLARCVKL